MLGHDALGKLALTQLPNHSAFVVSATFGNFTLSATVTVPDNASLAQTIANFGISATATAPDNATLSKTIPAITLSASVLTGDNAVLSKSIGNITLSATITNVSHADLAKTIAPITLVATTANVSHAVLDKTMDPITSYARGLRFYNFPPYPPPSYPITQMRNPVTISTGYGGGYDETVMEGLNSNLVSGFNLRWNVLTQAQKDQFEGFLEARFGADRFQYTVPGFGLTAMFSCAKWTFELIAPGQWSLSAQFDRKFDIA